MSKTAHQIYISSMVLIVIGVTIYLFYQGMSYYNTPFEERFYHDSHKTLKPSGSLGHGLGIVGTLLIIIGVFGYRARKYSRSLAKLGALKYWLEFHIFLCTIGPIMILFHTSFKFGGLVSISFWSMVAVVASGVVGRFIYLQIPRTIQGRELSLNEIQGMRSDTLHQIQAVLDYDKFLKIKNISSQSSQGGNILIGYLRDWKLKQTIRKQLLFSGVVGKRLKQVMAMIGREMNIQRKIDRLVVMQKLFNYWHVIHLPFAIIMLVIMLIHTGVTLALGYRWIF